MAKYRHHFKAIFTFVSLTAIAITALSFSGNQPRFDNHRSPTIDSIPLYTRSNTGYVMVLRQGDNVLDQIKTLAVTEKITGASISGFGFVNATFGFFDNKTKKYNPKKVTGELASLTGSIAWNSDTVSLHTHAIVTDSSFQAYGGHLLDATVGTGSVELFIVPTGTPLGRKVEQPLGANVLQLPAKD